MRLWKRIAIIIFVIVLLAQIPFVYNRYKFGRLAGKISTLETEKIITDNQNYNDFKGSIHVHSSIGGHSTGSFDELIDGAAKNALDFVIMTEHTSELFDSSEMTLRGARGGVLFVNGQEVETKSRDRFLLLNGSAEAGLASKISTPEFLQKIHADNKLAFITYPEKYQSWDAEFDGIEIFSLHTNAKKMNPVMILLDALWSFYSYPELVLTKYFQRPAENLQKFDEVTTQRKSTLFAGTDAHSNIGFHLFGDDAGNKIINIKIDAYETIFRTVRNHVLLEKDRELNQANLLDALKKGRCFIGFDALSDTSGFNFAAENGAEQKIMGDEIAFTESVNLKVVAPQIARFIIFKNGEKVFEEPDKTEVIFHAQEKGTYRTEVYLDSLGVSFGKMPWIISNPIYVR